MESFKISTLTEQFPNQLAQGKGGKVILAGDGDAFIFENIITTEGGDNRAILAPRLGMLQVLASLAPVFKPGCQDESGEVLLSLEGSNDRFPWRFETDNDGSSYTITVREQNIPDGVVFPAGGKIYLVWEGTEVKWVWSGGFVSAIPPKALWVLKTSDQAEKTLEQVKITLFSKIKIALRSIARDDTSGSIVLTEEGDKWFLRDDAENAKAKAILSPSLGMLQVIAQLAPVFRTKTPTTDKPCHSGDDPSHDAVDQKGDVGLSTAVSGKEFLWVFDERKEGGTTISAPAPAELGFPAGGRVYLVWELPNVKWEFSGGIVEDIPSNATWSLSPFDGGGKSCSGADDKARAKSVAPAT